MRGIFKVIGLVVLLGLVVGSLAQEDEAQRQGLVEEVRSLEERIQTLNAALVELRQVYNRLGGQVHNEASQEELQEIHAWLGGIIAELERDMLTISFEPLFERIGVLQQEFRAATLAFARHRLEAMQGLIETGEQAEEAAQELGRIRADVARGFADAADEAVWLELEEGLARLEEQVRAQSAEAGATLEEVLRRLDEALEP
jgi:uncharacterized coiled-coil DUF342 family protein